MPSFSPLSSRPSLQYLCFPVFYRSLQTPFLLLSGTKYIYIYYKYFIEHLPFQGTWCVSQACVHLFSLEFVRNGGQVLLFHFTWSYQESEISLGIGTLRPIPLKHTGDLEQCRSQGHQRSTYGLWLALCICPSSVSTVLHPGTV